MALYPQCFQPDKEFNLPCPVVPDISNLKWIKFFKAFIEYIRLSRIEEPANSHIQNKADCHKCGNNR